MCVLHFLLLPVVFFLKSKHLKCRSLTCSSILCTCYLLLFTPLLILVATNIHVWPYNTCVSRNNTLIDYHDHFRNKTSADTAVQSFASFCHCLWERSSQHSLNMRMDRHHTQYRWHPDGSSEADHVYLVLKT